MPRLQRSRVGDWRQRMRILMLSFGHWDRAAGRWFIRERIYRHGWTPFVWMRRRYKNEDISKFTEGGRGG